MTRAVLTIVADTSSVARSLGDFAKLARSTQALLTQEARRGATERVKTAQREASAVAAAYARVAKARRALEQSDTATAEREGRKRSRAAESESNQRKRSSQSAIATSMEGERRLTHETEAQSRRRLTTTEREAARRTSIAERQARREAALQQRAQTRAGERFDARLGSMGRSLLSGLGGGLSGAHGMIQDARAQRAAEVHTLNSAFYQAGIGPREASAMRQRLQSEVSTGSLRGLSLEQVATGITEAQTQFNILRPERGQTSEQNLDEVVRLLEFSRNTYQQPTEVLRFAGMLRQQGVTGADRMAAVRAATGLAQAGSVELSTMVQQGLGPLQQNIARSVNANMTPEQRRQAVVDTTIQTMATSEVTRGLTPRDSMNALSKMRETMSNERRMGDLYNRLTTEGGVEGRAVAARLYERRNGRMSLRQTDNPIAFMSDIVSGFGGDASRVSNLLSAGGPGAPMVLDSQQRRLVSNLASQTQSGGTIADAISRLRAEAGGFGAGDEARGRALIESEERTTLTATEEAQRNALTDNTNSVTGLSNAIRDWQVRHPFLTQGGSALAPLAMAAGGANAAAAALTGGAVAGQVANVSAILTGHTASGDTLSAPERVRRAAGFATGLAMGPTSVMGGLAQTAIPGLRDLGVAITNAIREGMNGSRPRVEVTPHEAAVAANPQARTIPGRR